MFQTALTVDHFPGHYEDETADIQNLMKCKNEQQFNAGPIFYALMGVRLIEENFCCQSYNNSNYVLNARGDEIQGIMWY